MLKFPKSLTGKVIVSTGIILVMVLGSNAVYSAYKSRQASIDQAKDSEEIIFTMIRREIHSLMVKGPLAVDDYLRTINRTEGIDEVRLVAGKMVEAEHGPAAGEHRAADQFERKALEDGAPFSSLVETNGSKGFRSIMAVRADNTCLQCHGVKPGDILGALSITLSLKKAERAGIALAKSQVVSALISIFLTGGLLLVLNMRLVTRPLREIASATRRMSEGDFNSRAAVPDTTELKMLAESFNLMAISLEALISEIVKASEMTKSYSSEILVAAEQQEVGAGEQSASVLEVTATMEELARNAEQIALSAEEVTGIAEKTLAAANDGQGTIAGTLDGIREISQKSMDLVKKIIVLSENVRKIGSIVEMIREIAEKSDLLALNAELEGTRAGEAGRGFTLVASEMRKLAENVKGAAGDIGRIVEEVNAAANSAAITTEQVISVTEAGSANAEKARESFASIFEHVRKNTSAAQQISAAIKEETKATEQVVAGMKETSQAISQNVAATEQATKIATEMSRLAGDLAGMVGRLKIARRS